MFKSFVFSTVVVTTLAFASTTFAARLIFVTGQGSIRDFCNTNAGPYCLENTKRKSQSESQRAAVHSCEFSYHGKARTYTASATSFCNPFSLPTRHDATWVTCDSTTRMSCEVND